MMMFHSNLSHIYDNFLQLCLTHDYTLKTKPNIFVSARPS